MLIMIMIIILLIHMNRYLVWKGEEFSTFSFGSVVSSASEHEEEEKYTISDNS